MAMWLHVYVFTILKIPNYWRNSSCNANGIKVWAMVLEFLRVTAYKMNIYIHIYIMRFIRMIYTLQSSKPNNGWLWMESSRIQHLFSSQDWVFQKVFSILWNPEEVGSNISEGIDLLAIQEQATKCKSSIYLYRLPTEGVTQIKGVCLPISNVQIEVYLHTSN